MAKAVWKDKDNNYLFGKYTYHYFTDSFYITIYKEDKNIGKFTWFEYSHCSSTDIGNFTVVDSFKNYKECCDYIVSVNGLNLSLEK